MRTQASRKDWVTCRLQFKDRRRPVMAPGKYTELFFLDEATALAAGHRPCNECRKDRFRAFKDASAHRAWKGFRVARCWWGRSIL